jgi:hemerythrin
MVKSELIKWSPTFSVGIKIIDEQHQELIKLTNNLFNHCVGDEEAERVYFKMVIGKAVGYIKIHFSTEERIMTVLKYKDYWEHKREHDAFVLTVVEQVRAFSEGKPFTLLSFTKFLKDWILTHIAVSDRKYSAYIKHVAAQRRSDVLLDAPPV